MTVVYEKTGAWMPRTEDCGTAEVSPGQKVVYSVMISVVTEPMRAGQSVTVAAQEVIVYTDVLNTVDVVTSGVETVGLADGDDVGELTGVEELAGGEREVLDVEVGVIAGPEDEVDDTPAVELELDVVVAELEVVVVSLDWELDVELDVELEVELLAVDVELEVEEAEDDVEDVGGGIV
jgi:hypothetical protein